MTLPQAFLRLLEDTARAVESPQIDRQIACLTELGCTEILALTQAQNLQSVRRGLLGALAHLSDPPPLALDTLAGLAGLRGLAEVFERAAETMTRDDFRDEYRTLAKVYEGLFHRLATVSRGAADSASDDLSDSEWLAASARGLTGVCGFRKPDGGTRTAPIRTRTTRGGPLS